MDEVIRKSIQQVASKQKGQVPWELDEPFDQSYHAWSGNTTTGKWKAINKADTTTSDSRPQNDQSANKIVLYSWNIDFMLPYPDSRMHAGIRHLQTLIEKQPSNLPTVIFLAECLSSDLKLLSSDPWIQQTFHLTDLDETYWQSGHYGTTILVDRRLASTRCFRVHYAQSRMERDGLFVDISVKDGKTLRLCNTHLESLALEPAYRPPQMKLCAKYMHDGVVDGAVLAGDLNAIQDFDRYLHSDNDLKDAYLELGGSEDDAEKGHTWGQQAATHLRNQFGTSRMDKVFYCGKVECFSFERFGQGVEVEDEEEREVIVKLGFDRPWITDHYGVKVILEVS